jgi:acetyltransferase
VGFEGCPFEVVGLFCDNPLAPALQRAKELGIPSVSIDIKAFCEARGKTLKDKETRREYDKKAIELISAFNPDLILLAGYVWAVSDSITDAVLTVGVHPADLAIEKLGKRAYAGADGVKATLLGGEREIRASSYIATSVIDGGPILFVSPAVQIHPADTFTEQERKKHYLHLVNEEARLLGARTVHEIALGEFAFQDGDTLIYKGKFCPKGIRIDAWGGSNDLDEALRKAFNSPKSVAVLGASNRPGLGNAVLENIVKYEFNGMMYAVNLSGESVGSVPGYTSILDIPGEVDLGILAVPTSSVIEATEACGKKGVKAVAVLTAGFKETGAEGEKAEETLKSILHRYGMRMLGPNCMGLFNTNPALRLNANMLSGFPRRGGVGVITQSGAIGAALVDFSESMGIGFSMVYSTGNQTDLTACDLLPLLAQDSSTKVIFAYLETIPDPPRFFKVLSATTAKKPVIVLKSGRTSAGALAASSHTGSLATSDSATEALLKKAGCIRAQTLEEAYLLCAALEAMPQPKGRKVGIISNAGGPGTLVADALDLAGFSLPIMNDAQRAALADIILPQASTSNPLDLVATAKPEHYAHAAKALMESDLYDAILIVVVPPTGVDTGQVAASLASSLSSCRIPMYSCFLGPNIGAKGRKAILAAGIPCFEYPEQMVTVLDRISPPASNTSLDLVESSAIPLIPPARPWIKKDFFKSVGNGDYVAQEICFDLLESYGLDCVHSAMLTNPTSIIPKGLDFPLVAKIDHPEIVHKSDVGGVVFGITDSQSLLSHSTSLFAKFPGARGVLLQEYIDPGMEMFLGALKDPTLGHTIAIGSGGTRVEIDHDFLSLYLPVRQAEVQKCLSALRCYPLLKGYRGKKGIDAKKLIEAVMRLQALLLDFPEIIELDINPLICTSTRVVVADTRIRIGCL